MLSLRLLGGSGDTLRLAKRGAAFRARVRGDGDVYNAGGDAMTRMTIEDAAAILNRARHGDHDDWIVIGDALGQIDSSGDPIFTRFEAVAIAEQYCRDWAAASACYR